MNNLRTAILVPTLNAGPLWASFLDGIDMQKFSVSRKIILDSGSSDETVVLGKRHNFEVMTIDKSEFDHGYARQILAEAAEDCDILVYLTQDSILKTPNAIENLVKAFEQQDVGLSYGRQLPQNGAKTLETHARLFNYPPTSITKALQDKEQLGIKTASCSNSFAAYRKNALMAVGGFPKHTIFAEDVIVGGKMLIQHWKISYVADAEVYHSHDYTPKEEFKRYFDIGVYHSTNQWLLNEFGKADGEGLKYVLSELKYVVKNDMLVLPKMFASIVAKFAGYKLGMMHKSLSLNLRKSFSMHSHYWDSNQA